MLVVKLIRFGRKELYKLSSAYNAELVDKIKQVPKDMREWNVVAKEWYLTALGVYTLITLYKGRKGDIHFQFEDEKQRTEFGNIINKHRNRIAKEQARIDNLNGHNQEIIDYKDNLPTLTENFDYGAYLKPNVVPMPHQVYSAHFAKKLLENDNSCLFAMDMGTGKTISSLLAVEMMPDIKKVLFIVPANLRLNIQDEVHKFTNSFCYVPQVKKKAKTGEYYLTKYKRNIKPIEECKYIVMSYDYFADSKFDSNLKILSMGLHMVDMIVFDEMHMITNKKANRTSNITKTYGLIVKKYLGLSATPLRGNIEKFFPILKLLKPEEYRNESKFLEEYAGMRYMQGNGNNRGGLVKVSEPKFDKLNESLQTLMYRVKKEEVLKDLPPLMRNKILIELTPKEMQEYKKIEDGFAKVDWYNTGVTVTETQEKSALGIMIRIRQYLAMVKTRKSIELMHELNDYGEKCLVFDMFKDPLYSILPQMRTPTKLYSGDINMDEKQNLIYEFQEEKNLKNMLLTTGAGAVGITLTEARNVILQTLSLSPDENEQAIARAYRKGQNHSVFAYTLVVADTLDEEIYDYLSEKQSVFNSVIDGTEYIDMSEEKTIEDILGKMKLKYNV